MESTQTPTPKDAETFGITDEKSATWLLRKLRAIDEEQEAITAATAQRLKELQADRERLMGRFGSELEAWAREEAQKRHRKTITLPLAGMAVAFRTNPARLVVESEADAISAARAGVFLFDDNAPSFFSTVETFDRAAYLAHAKATLETTGEVLPGVAMTEERESFSVKAIKAKETTESA